MKAVFDVNKNVLEDNNIVPSADVWKELGDELNKRPQNIYCHCHKYIHPTLVRFEAGVLDVDFKETLINYMVDNNIMFAQEANWDEIVKNPLFHGTTAAYLSKIYSNVAGDAKKKYSNISNSEMTSVYKKEKCESQGLGKTLITLFLHIRA